MKVDIYYKPTCPYCHKALDILDHKGIKYNSYDIVQNPKKKEEMIQRMGDRIGKVPLTVPQIFIDWKDNGKYEGIGGYDSLYQLYVKKKL